MAENMSRRYKTTSTDLARTIDAQLRGGAGMEGAFAKSIEKYNGGQPAVLSESTRLAIQKYEAARPPVPNNAVGNAIDRLNRITFIGGLIAEFVDVDYDPSDGLTVGVDDEIKVGARELWDAFKGKEGARDWLSKSFMDWINERKTLRTTDVPEGSSDDAKLCCGITLHELLRMCREKFGVEEDPVLCFAPAVWRMAMEMCGSSVLRTTRFLYIIAYIRADERRLYAMIKYGYEALTRRGSF